MGPQLFRGNFEHECYNSVNLSLHAKRNKVNTRGHVGLRISDCGLGIENFGFRISDFGLGIESKLIPVSREGNVTIEPGNPTIRQEASAGLAESQGIYFGNFLIGA